jgi:hypothetical protein
MFIKLKKLTFLSRISIISNSNIYLPRQRLALTSNITSSKKLTICARISIISIIVIFIPRQILALTSNITSSKKQEPPENEY